MARDGSPGHMGREQRDYPVIMGILMLSSMMTLGGNLLADVGYALAIRGSVTEVEDAVSTPGLVTGRAEGDAAAVGAQPQPRPRLAPLPAKRSRGRGRVPARVPHPHHRAGAAIIARGAHCGAPRRGPRAAERHPLVRYRRRGARLLRPHPVRRADLAGGGVQRHAHRDRLRHRGRLPGRLLRGLLDELLSRGVDFFLSLPIFYIIIVVQMLLHPGTLGLVFLISLFFWMPVARLVRGLGA